MAKGQRNEWFGLSAQIAALCGCSMTTVSKILNGKSEEVTTNVELIQNIKQTAARLIQEQRNILLAAAERKREVAERLVA